MAAGDAGQRRQKSSFSQAGGQSDGTPTSYRGSARTLRPSRRGNVCAPRPVGIVPRISTSPPVNLRSPALYFDAVENPLGARKFETWLRPDARYSTERRRVPHRPRWPVDRAIITHGHSDMLGPVTGPYSLRPRRSPSCRPGSARAQPAAFRNADTENGSRSMLSPLGLFRRAIFSGRRKWTGVNGQRAVVSGDYKRAPDPTVPRSK